MSIKLARKVCRRGRDGTRINSGERQYALANPLNADPCKPYDTGAGGFCIDGGNIHLHDAITDPVSNDSQSTSASTPPEGGTQAAPESGSQAAPESSSAPASDQPASGEEPVAAESSYDPAAEPAGSPDVIQLESMLVSSVPAGTPMVLIAIVENHGGSSDGTPVTLRWTSPAGIPREAAAVVNAAGIASFVVVMPAGDVSFIAWAGELSSNGVRVNGF